MGRPDRSAERREDILAAAIALIERHDLATLRLSDIAAELGLTPNAVRYYFKDVEALVLELALRSDVRFNDERRALAATIADPKERLVRVIEAGLPQGREDAEWRAIWRAFLAAGFELHEHTDVAGIFHRQVALYAEVLADGVSAGAFTLAASAEDVAVTIMSMEDYLGYRIVARDPAFDRPRCLGLIHAYAQLATDTALPVPK